MSVAQTMRSTGLLLASLILALSAGLSACGNGVEMISGPKSTIVHYQRSITINPLARGTSSVPSTTRLTATCASGEQELAGGFTYNEEAAQHSYLPLIIGSYPSDETGNPHIEGASRSWTVEFLPPLTAHPMPEQQEQVTLTVYVTCLQSSVPVKTTVVQAKRNSEMESTINAFCPSEESYSTGGGFRSDEGVVTASHPLTTTTGWQLTILHDAQRLERLKLLPEGPRSTTTYAVCTDSPNVSIHTESTILLVRPPMTNESDNVANQRVVCNAALNLQPTELCFVVFKQQASPACSYGDLAASAGFAIIYDAYYLPNTGAQVNPLNVHVEQAKGEDQHARAHVQIGSSMLFTGNEQERLFGYTGTVATVRITALCMAIF